MKQLLGTKLVLALIFMLGIRVDAGDGPTLSGSISDPQGQAVSGANISLLRRADSTRRETKAGDGGGFSFGAVDAGEYRMTAEAPGFRILTRTVVIRAEDGAKSERSKTHV